MKNKRAAIYTRMASSSPDLMRRMVGMCGDVATDYGLEVMKEIQDLEGQKNGLQELMKLAIEGEIDVVICYNAERLSQDVLELITIFDVLRSSNCELIFAYDYGRNKNLVDKILEFIDLELEAQSVTSAS